MNEACIARAQEAARSEVAKGNNNILFKVVKQG